MPQSKKGIDWKWIVIAGGILSRVITTGTINCIGVFFDDIKGAFPDASNTQLSIVFSIAPGLLEGTGVLASMLMNKIKARYLVIVGSIVATAGVIMASRTSSYIILLIGFGIMNGMGQGMARCLLPIAVTFSFDEKTRHIAFAILNGGDGLGGVLCPIMFAYLLEAFSWRNTLLVVAAMTANLCVSGCTVPLSLRTTNVAREKKIRKESLRRKISGAEPTPVPNQGVGPQNHEMTHRSNSSSGAVTNGEIVTAEDEQTANILLEEPDVPLFPNLMFFYANILTHSIAYFIFMTFVFSDMKEQGIPSNTVSMIVSIIGGVSIIGRVSVGIMDNKKVRRWFIYMMGHIIRSLVVFAFQVPLPGVPQTIKYGVLCALYGLTDGVTGSLIPLVCVDLFGLNNFGLVLGWEMFLMGSGAFIGVPLAGAMYDIFKSYRIPFLFSACSFMVAGLVLIPLYWTKKRYQLVTAVSLKSRLAERKFSL